jgi:ATP-dependent protease HslVU (ClpYQ) peptidase subunit
MTQLLRHLEQFFSSLLSSKEFWAAIVGAVAAAMFSRLEELERHIEAQIEEIQKMVLEAQKMILEYLA